ncbi:hypothetical protein FB468_1024 [Leucobacter komagatae]|uniref:BNR/Asp-box repeat protein n=1 Tax=Leucobacter komagatae TaxID=55969 RepID=A0A542Y4L8_9MICO|nr:sialidase family protein [Leucobacter komagatae]TQL43012.1 hypothetical protein FB468_1024 [Leucobacter komagatae]
MKTRIPLIIAAFAAALTLTACAPNAPSGNASAGTSAPGAAGTASLADLEHVHAVTGAPDSDNLLLATHQGIYTLSATGDLTGPIGGNRFDAMGFATLGTDLVASGHPGPDTPAELGSPNLGIIQSDDAGASWKPVALTGVEDFHVLTAGEDGVLYGVGSSRPNIVVSADGGRTWADRAALPVADLALSGGVLYATTEQGLQRSADGGATFEAVPDSPALALIEALPGGQLAGIASDGVLWRGGSDAGWEQLGTVAGRPQALGTSGERVIVLDDRGVVEYAGGETKVIL